MGHFPPACPRSTAELSSLRGQGHGWPEGGRPPAQRLAEGREGYFPTPGDPGVERHELALGAPGLLPWENNFCSR